MTTDIELVTATDAENPVLWDWRLVNGDLVWITGAAAIGQHVKQRLQLFLREYFLDRSQGVPWFQRTFGFPVDRTYTSSVLRRVIEGTPGIASATVTSFTYTGAARNFSISYDAVTDEGEPITADDFQPLRV